MYGPRLVAGLAAVFATIAGVFAILGVIVNLVFLPVAALFGGVAYLTWYHASGRLASRIYRTVEQQAAHEGPRTGGSGAGPREEWVPPRDGRTAAESAGPTAGRRVDGGRQRAGQRRASGRRAGDPGGQQRPSEADYRVLGIDPGADETRVREAYRERVKEVHPDADGGSESEFKRVKTAYERLTNEGS